MNLPQKNSWTQVASKEGLVSIGTHSLFLCTAGPPRTGSEPVVIIEAGHGDFSDSWKAVMRAISPFARVYAYDRAGYAHSEPSPSPRTATNIATELRALLEATGLDGTYIMVGHSYGGVLVREFAAANLDECVGLVLVDTVQEDDLNYEWPIPALVALTGSLDRHEVIGLTKTTKLTPEEWNIVVQLENQESHKATEGAEANEIFSSGKSLGDKKQFDTCAFGDRPLSVIKGDHAGDFQKIYEAGVKAENGTAEERDVLKKFNDGIDTIWERNTRRQLDLSSKSRMVYAEKSGHQVHMQQPELIAEEIKWVLDSL